MSIKSVFHFLLVNSLFVLVLLLSGALLANMTWAETQEKATHSHHGKSAVIDLQVYKSPTCGCCGKWIDHLSTGGFKVQAHNEENMSAIKSKNAIGSRYRSCHTGISKDGYIFEGHVPAKFIKQFLNEKPANAIGLAVPGMPVGSPGMEVQNKFMPYQVLMLMKDGSHEVYATLKTIEAQF